MPSESTTKHSRADEHSSLPKPVMTPLYTRAVDKSNHTFKYVYITSQASSQQQAQSICNNKLWNIVHVLKYIPSDFPCSWTKEKKTLHVKGIDVKIVHIHMNSFMHSFSFHSFRHPSSHHLSTIYPFTFSFSLSSFHPPFHPPYMKSPSILPLCTHDHLHIP